MSLHSTGKPLALGRKGGKAVADIITDDNITTIQEAMALPGWWVGVLALKWSNPNTAGMRSDTKKTAGLGA